MPSIRTMLRVLVVLTVISVISATPDQPSDEVSKRVAILLREWSDTRRSFAVKFPSSVQQEMNALGKPARPPPSSSSTSTATSTSTHTSTTSISTHTSATSTPTHTSTTSTSTHTSTTSTSNPTTSSPTNSTTKTNPVPRAQPPMPPASPRVDIRLMTKAEWKEYCDAVLAIMKQQAPDTSHAWFDVFAGYHRNSEAPAAHGSLGFLAWHAKFSHAYETLLRQKKPNVVIPVWDPRPDTLLPSHCDSCIHTAELLGNSDDVVSNGPFKNKTVYPPDCRRTSFGPKLSRSCTADFKSALINYGEFDYFINTYRLYSHFHRPYDTAFEDTHGGLHVAIGGHLNILSCAANDPFFYMLHAFVHAIFDICMDRQYSQAQQNNLQYPDRFDVPAASKGYAKAVPFDTPLRDCLKESMQRGHKFIMVPPTCSADADCNFRGDQNAYWCKSGRPGRCASKIRIGGVCTDRTTGKYPNNACFRERFCTDDPICRQGVCQCHKRDGSVVNTPPKTDL